MSSGWTLTSLATNQGTACPAQATQTDVYEGPNGSGACGCGCSLSSNPTCPNGPIAVTFDENFNHSPLACNNAGMPANMNNASACNTDMFAGGAGVLSYKALDLEYTPAAPTGGACAPNTQTNAGAVTYASHDRVCTPNPEPCSGGQCTLSVSAPYQVCISQSGLQACPSSTFTQPHVVGGPATFTCSSSGCSCSVVTESCTGTLKLYANNNCTGDELTIAADGKCHDPMATDDAYASYQYVASPLSASSCSTSGTSAVQNLTVANATTICCAP